jgi:hypothetical protein
LIAVEPVTRGWHTQDMTPPAVFQAKLYTHPALDRPRTTTSRRYGGELLPNNTKFLNNFKSAENIQQLKEASKAVVKTW